ncbi:MAG: glycosyltransferase family 4 protein [Parcubacteria group bacterium]|jgi:glycosyltransferase involved in cell wall biosynthesis
MKRILLITRPIAPPWDEASKNFAFYLASNVKAVNFGMLTKGAVAELPANVTQHPMYTSSSLNLSLWQKLKLLKLISIRRQYDVLHFMLTPAKLNSFAFKNFIVDKKTKSVQTIPTLREDLFGDADLKKILFADLIITYSDHAKNKLNALGFKNVKRVYPGIDLNYYSPAAKDAGALKKLGIAPQDFIVTYPGEYVRLGATDDIVAMILQYADILKEKRIKIIFACRLKNNRDILKKEEIMKKIAQQGLVEQVLFINTYADMAQLYNLSDVIIFPVRNMRGKFDVPLAAIEPMACEKPVIISDLPILQEFANPENSVTIERGNVAQLKDAILELYDNPDKRSALGKGGRKFCAENFDIKKVAEIYQKIYEEL